MNFEKNISLVITILFVIYILACIYRYMFGYESISQPMQNIHHIYFYLCFVIVYIIYQLSFIFITASAWSFISIASYFNAEQYIIILCLDDVATQGRTAAVLNSVLFCRFGRLLYKNLFVHPIQKCKQFWMKFVTLYILKIATTTNKSMVLFIFLLIVESFCVKSIVFFLIFVFIRVPKQINGRINHRPLT